MGGGQSRAACCETLSDLELVSVVVGGGEGSREKAERLFERYGTVSTLASQDVESLMSIDGIGRASAFRLLAAMELGRRLFRRRNGRTIRGPADVAGLLVGEIGWLDREQFVILILDSKNGVVGVETVTVGGLNSSIVSAREVFKPVIVRNGASLILAHNHPSGNPKPSPEDVVVTERLARSGEILGISVLDHLIIAGNEFISLREEGLLPELWEPQMKK
jgi:DNA repair protein RadC